MLCACARVRQPLICLHIPSFLRVVCGLFSPLTVSWIENSTNAAPFCSFLLLFHSFLIFIHLSFLFGTSRLTTSDYSARFHPALFGLCAWACGCVCLGISVRVLLSFSVFALRPRPFPSLPSVPGEAALWLPGISV